MQLARKLVSSRGGARAAILATTAFGYGVGAKTQGSMLPLQSIVTLVGQMDDDSSRKDGSDKSWKETVRKVSEDVKEGWEGSKEEAARKAVDMKKKVKDFYFQNVSLENAYKGVQKGANELIPSGVPGQISLGFCMGFCAGYFAKTVAKGAIFVVGLGFCSLQALSYSGIIYLDWKELEKAVQAKLDRNGDGKVDGADLTIMRDEAMEMVQYNIPTECGFASGFILGVRVR
eukprot:132328_1